MSAAPGGLASCGEVERLSEVQSQHYSELHTTEGNGVHPPDARDTGGTLASKKPQLSTTDDSEPANASLCVDCCSLS